MPYIERERRQSVAAVGPANVGDLTYVLFKECLQYVGQNPRYQDLAEVLAALEGCKLEFYRRRVAPYEDRKIVANGDVT